ncbi:hypothetical protein LINGRAHAP2_LOCUS17975 [Linum grandiflorum]
MIELLRQSFRIRFLN